MKKIFQLLVFLLFSLTALSAQSPTWSEDVACIVYNNCASCHHSGGIAPFSLTSYGEAFPYRFAIREAVESRHMPPWPPEPDYQEYTHERLLTADEIARIKAWVEGGAPEGNMSQAPEPPVLTNGDVIAEPDWRMQLPAYTSQAQQGDEYRCFVVPSEFAQDRFITGFEVVPGNPEIVHHVLVFYDQSGIPDDLDGQDPDPGYLCFGGIGSNSAQLIGGWVPGQRPTLFPEGMGVRLPAGAKLVVQLHYPAGTAGEVDDTHVNFTFSDQPNLREVRMAPVLNHVLSMVDGPLFIPANTVRTFHQRFFLQQDVSVLSALPHMHLIGRSIRSFAVTPAGDTLRFVNIPTWDFHWQSNYTFTQPIKVPRGSILHAEATYDNTLNNPHNPNNPPRDVHVGEATTDEMMLVYFTFMAYQPGDEDFIMGPRRQPPLVDCLLSTGVTRQLLPEDAIRLFPNPAGDYLAIQNTSGDKAHLRLFNTNGQEVWSQPDLTGEARIATHSLPAGIYWLEMRTPQGRLQKKVVIGLK